MAATLNAKTYQTGENVTDQEMGLLRIRTHKTLPEWNYTIKPQTRERRTNMRNYFCVVPYALNTHQNGPYTTKA